MLLDHHAAVLPQHCDAASKANCEWQMFALCSIVA